MNDLKDRIEIRLDLPREALKDEEAAAGPDYKLGEPKSLPPDPEAMEARFVDPVTLIVVITLSVLAERVLHHALAKRGKGVLVDTREKPPHVSMFAGVPQGFVLLIHPDGKPQEVRADVAPDYLSNLIAAALKAS